MQNQPLTIDLHPHLLDRTNNGGAGHAGLVFFS